MKIFVFLLLLGLALEHVCSVPVVRQDITNDLFEVAARNSEEKDIADEADNEEDIEGNFLKSP